MLLIADGVAPYAYLTAALTPTMAIEVAPAAVASIALVFASDDRITTPIMFLAGYGVLMVCAQLPRYLTLSFSLGTWAFTFSLAAVASAGLFWIAVQDPVGARVWTDVVLTGITALIGAISYRTLLGATHHQLLSQVQSPIGSTT